MNKGGKPKPIVCPHCGKVITGKVDLGKMIRIEDAAKYLGLSIHSLYKYTQQRKIQYSKPNNGIIYFTKESLDKYASKNKKQTV